MKAADPRAVLRTDDVELVGYSTRCSQCLQPEGAMHSVGCKGQRAWVLGESMIEPEMSILEHIRGRISELEAKAGRADAGGHFGDANRYDDRRDELQMLEEFVVRLIVVTTPSKRPCTRFGGCLHELIGADVCCCDDGSCD